MRDFPIFTTELGIASLTLSQIPYTKKAYIRIQSTLDGEKLLQECAGFCKAAGAEEIYCTGHETCEAYLKHTDILKMQADRCSVGETDALLFPVTEKTVEKYREIYNSKIAAVPNGAWMTIAMGQKLLQDGGAYFVHRNGDLLGIGQLSGPQISWVAAIKQGAGADVVRALCHGIFEDRVILEVASENQKAMALYEKLGFLPVELISSWYRYI